MCKKSVNAVNHLSDKLVQSVTVKNKPKTGDGVCALKDAVVKSEKDKFATICGKEPQKKKEHRALTLRGTNPRDVLSFVCQNMMACLYRL